MFLAAATGLAGCGGEESLGDRLDAAIGKSREGIEALDRGDAAAAKAIFDEHVHPITHEIEHDLEERNAQAGEELHDTVLEIEDLFLNGGDSQALRAQFERLTTAMATARDIMAGPE